MSEPTYSFVDAFRQVKQAARARRIRLTRSECTKITGFWIALHEMSEQAQQNDQGGRTIMYRDPTGDKAIQDFLVDLANTHIEKADR